MTEMKVNPIGVIRNSEEGCCIKIQEKFVPALLALEGFSHIQVIWWFSGFDDELSRSLLQAQKPYKHGPDTMGILDVYKRQVTAGLSAQKTARCTGNPASYTPRPAPHVPWLPVPRKPSSR